MFSELVRLFTNIPRAKVAKYFLLQPDIRATAEQVASAIGLTKEAVRRETAALSRMGLLTIRRSGATNVCTLSSNHPYARELRDLLKVATSASDKEIADFFRDTPGLSLLAVAGIFTDEERSSLDLLIVTRRPNDQRVHSSVRRLERHLALPLRYAVLETREFRERMEARDRLLRDVFEYSHKIVTGKV